MPSQRISGAGGGRFNAVQKTNNGSAWDGEGNGGGAMEATIARRSGVRTASHSVIKRRYELKVTDTRRTKTSCAGELRLDAVVHSLPHIRSRRGWMRISHIRDMRRARFYDTRSPAACRAA